VAPPVIVEAVTPAGASRESAARGRAHEMTIGECAMRALEAPATARQSPHSVESVGRAETVPTGEAVMAVKTVRACKTTPSIEASRASETIPAAKTARAAKARYSAKTVSAAESGDSPEAAPAAKTARAAKAGYSAKAMSAAESGNSPKAAPAAKAATPAARTGRAAKTTTPAAMSAAKTTMLAAESGNQSCVQHQRKRDKCDDEPLEHAPLPPLMDGLEVDPSETLRRRAARLPTSGLWDE
jgi:hypothetical protein